MKKVLFFLATVFAFANLNAQHIQKGQIDVNVGIGLIASYTGSGVASAVPPITATAEYALNDKISVGALLGFSTGASDKITFFDGTYAKWNYSYVIAGARGAYHFNLFDKLDTYAGLNLGYIVVTSNLKTNDPYLANLSSPSASGFGWAAFAGARYHFNEKFGAFAELGYGVAVLNIGATAKF